VARKYSSEPTVRDWIEWFAKFEPRTTGLVVTSWDAESHLLTLSGDADLLVGDQFWMPGVEAISPITEAAVEPQRFLAYIVKRDDASLVVEPRPWPITSGEHRIVTREPVAGDEVWALFRKDEEVL